MSRATVHATRHPALRPGERLCLLAELGTPAGTVAEVAYAPGWCERRHRHREASLIYVVAGDHWATHSRGGDTARAGTVRYLPPNEPHETYFPVGSTCLQLVLHPATLDLAASQGPALECPGELRDARAVELGSRLHRELFMGDDLAQLDVEGVALELLLTREHAEHSRRRGPPLWVLQIGEMLHAEAHTRFALQEIARSVGRHPVQVSRQFHEHFGCTMSEYVRRARVARAQYLLRRASLTITEVALTCGFADQSHFTRVFSRLTGVSPGRYRVAYLS